MKQKTNKFEEKNSQGEEEENEDEDQSYNEFIVEEEVEKIIQFVTKIKRISKERLNKIKQENKTVKRLFKEMSEFFVSEKRKNKEEKKMRQKICKESKEKRKIMYELKMKSQSETNMSQYISAPTGSFYQLGHQENWLNASEISPENPNDEKNEPEIEEEHPERPEAPKPFHCYICRVLTPSPSTPIYPLHCPKCAETHLQKRNQSANLKGLTALVTGARVKIGFETVMKLLRDGAMVYATTRFPNDAVARYKKQEGYEEWGHRLVILQCDLIDKGQVEGVIRYMKENVKKLDILIHNAAQTIARPIEFYSLELENERKPLEIEDQKKVVKFQENNFPSLQYSTPQLQLENATSPSEISFNILDEFNQPLDMRPKNSWTLPLPELPLSELLCTQLINSIMPTYMTSQLLPLLTPTPSSPSPSFIINTSSMEGSFSRSYKSSNHIHTNMAKAALNMMTRTSAGELSKNKIFVNSVDTGWVTNMNPYPIQKKMEWVDGFVVPLDCKEGAMRILDPIYQGVRDGKYWYGMFFKDYLPTSW